MQIYFKPCGELGTNCYIVENGGEFVVIDPGDGALEFVKEHCDFSNLKAIFATHCHFDHIFDAKIIKQNFGNPPFYAPKGDEILCQNDPFGLLKEPVNADFWVRDEKVEKIGLEFYFAHFPGHTPGCSVIILKDFNLMFSGDFIFRGSIGRFDFPFSDKNLMKTSLEMALNLPDFTVYPGHGAKTSMETEKRTINYFLTHQF